jgi:hypothetical protein
LALREGFAERNPLSVGYISGEQRHSLWRANRFALLLIAVKAYPRILRELLFSTSTIGVPFVDASP